MRTLILSLVLLLASSQAFAQKAAPDGFGPIKFGMTKDEAWDAIDGKGEWVDTRQGKALRYSLSSTGLATVPFVVEQRFVAGLAAHLYIRPSLPFHLTSCANNAAEIIAGITLVYDKTPIVITYEPANVIQRSVTFYYFLFADGSSIWAMFEVPNDIEASGYDPECLLTVRYDSSLSPDYALPY